MSVLWTSPLALFGIALIALPIAIHLLVKHQVRTLPYPSLRFLRQTQLAALRRRTIEDVLLLVCRCAIVTAAAIALAGPVLQTTSRRAEQAARVSRAVVQAGDLPPDLALRLADGAFASTTIRRAVVADAVGDALRWLDSQPRSAREIVFAGELRRGGITAAEIALIPESIGIRFEQSATDQPAQTTMPMLQRRDGSIVRVERVVTLAPESTRVSDGASSAVDAELVSIVASAADTALAEASLRAALDAGVPWRDFTRRVVVAWEGADPTTLQERARGAEVVRMPVPQPASRSADDVRTALMRVGGVELREPVALAPEQLQAWSRQAGEPSSSAPVVDEGDRRWLWALALVLLALEWRLRRSRIATIGTAQSGEVRVA